MPGKEIKGRSKIANYRYGGRTGKQTGGRTNLLEELGRVEAEPSNRNRRAEISRVHGELNRGYKTGGRIGFKEGLGAAKRRPKKGPKKAEPKGGEPKSSSTKKQRALRIQKEDIASGETAAAKAFMTRNLPYTGDIHGKKFNKGGRIGFKKGTNKK